MSQVSRMERLRELQRQLRIWQTRVWMRHAESPATSEEAASCRSCRGTGIAHFCLISHGDSPAERAAHPPKDECLHPNQVELAELDSIKRRAGELLVESLASAAGGGRPSVPVLLPMPPPMPHEFKASTEEEVSAMLRRYGYGQLVHKPPTEILSIVDRLSDSDLPKKKD